MLFEVSILYADGKKERNIVSNTKIYPKRDNIVFAGFMPFKYKVKQHRILCQSIVKFGEKYFIYPQQIECHPETTLDDIKVIKPKSKTKKIVEKTTIIKPIPVEYKFESKSNPGSFYVVTVANNKVNCNCSGRWRAKDRDKGCTHMQQVRKQLELK